MGSGSYPRPRLVIDNSSSSSRDTGIGFSTRASSHSSRTRSGGSLRCLHFSRVFLGTPHRAARAIAIGQISSALRIMAYIGDYLSPLSRLFFAETHWVSPMRMSPCELRDMTVSYKDAFIARVVAARVAAGKTQAEIAEALRIDVRRYQKYEQRTEMPHMFIAAYCQITDVRLEWLMTGRGQMKPAAVPAAAKGAA